MIAAALRGALSDRAREGRVHVVTSLVSGDVPSTRTALGALAAVTKSEKVLVVIHRDEDLTWLSLRNALAVHAIAVDQLNAYDVLVNDEIVFTVGRAGRVRVPDHAGRVGHRITAEPPSTSRPIDRPRSTEATDRGRRSTEADPTSVEPTDAELASRQRRGPMRPTETEEEAAR